MSQGMHVLHGCGWAHVNLKPSKVQIKKAENSPKLHCTVVDLGCSIGVVPDVSIVSFVCSAADC